MTDKYHSELMSEVRAHARQLSRSEKEKLEKYLGTNKTLTAMRADTQRKIIKE